MWDSIAETQLGSSTYVAELIQANLQHRTYYLFPSGIVLDLPEVDSSTTTMTSNLKKIPPWKRGIK